MFTTADTQQDQGTDLRCDVGFVCQLGVLTQADSCPQEDLHVEVWERRCCSESFQDRRSQAQTCTGSVYRASVCVSTQCSQPTPLLVGVLLRPPSQAGKSGALSNGQQPHFLSRVRVFQLLGFQSSVRVRGSTDTTDESNSGSVRQEMTLISTRPIHVLASSPEASALRQAFRALQPTCGCPGRTAGAGQACRSREMAL